MKEKQNISTTVAKLDVEPSFPNAFAIKEWIQYLEYTNKRICTLSKIFIDVIGLCLRIYSY